MSDDLIERLRSKYCCDNECHCDEAADRIAALETEVAAAKAGRVTVKPLLFDTSSNALTHYAESIMGTWSIWPGYYRAPFSQKAVQSGKAKAAAQADYSARIMSALTLSPEADPVGKDAVAEAARVLLDDLAKALGTDGSDEGRKAGRRWSQAHDAAETAPTAMVRPTPIQMIRAALRAISEGGE